MGAFSTSVIRPLTGAGGFGALVIPAVADLHAELVAVGVDALGDRRIEVRDLVAQGRELVGVLGDAVLEHVLGLAVGSFEPDQARHLGVGL